MINPDQWVRVQGGAYKYITLPAPNVIFQSFTLFTKNTGVINGEFYLRKKQRTSLLYKCTIMLPNPQKMVVF
jgi:hypothetical protein